MKTRTDLHAGEAVCPQANLWKKRANNMADALSTCKKIIKNLPDYPIYGIPGEVVIGNLPYIGGNAGYYPGGYNIGGYNTGGYNTAGTYDGRDYSGLCG